MRRVACGVMSPRKTGSNHSLLAVVVMVEQPTEEMGADGMLREWWR